MEKTNLKKKKVAKKWIAAGIAAAVAVGLIVWMVPDSSAEEEAEVTTAAAEVMTIENTLSSDGEVQSSLEEDISPHTSYYLEEVKVEAGEALEEGDTILTYTNGSKMTAPYNCVVTSLMLPEEEEQLTTDHYVSISGTDVLQMELTVDEDDVSLVKAGDEATVSVSATGSSCEGVVTSVSEVGEYASSGSSFTAYITFENDGNIKLGMNGTAEIVLEKAENVIGVPVDAVSTKDGESYVTVQKEDGTTEDITVETGIKNDAYIEISSGLSEGDTVIVPESEDSSSSNEGFMGGPGEGGMPDGGGMPGDNNAGPGGAPGGQ